MIERFFKWWWSELCALLPAGLSGRGRQQGPQLRLLLEGNQVRAERRSGKQTQLLDSVPLSAAAQTETVDRWTVGLSPLDTQVQVYVPREKALLREITLPLAAEENLRQVVGFEMERQTPFKAGDVYFDYDVVERDHRSKTLTLNLRVATRAVVDKVIVGLGAWQLEPWSDSIHRAAHTGNDTAQGDGSNAVALNFRPAAYSKPKTGRVGMVLAAVNLLLLAALITLPILEKQRQLERLDVELNSAKLAAAEAMSVRAAVEAKQDALRLLVKLKGAQPSSVAVLEELSQRLPDSTWLYRLDLHDGKAALQGTSETATALIALLDASAMLRGIRFASPVTREPNTGRERFHVAADVVLPQPNATTLGLSSAASSTAAPGEQSPGDTVLQKAAAEAQ